MISQGYAWSSRRGAGREINLDAGAIVTGRDFTLAFVLDTASPSPSDGAFARTFVAGVARAVSVHRHPSFDTCKTLCKEERDGLLGRYPGDRFCFAMLHVDRLEDAAWMLTIGDCRVGRHRFPGEAEWLTPVHCAATLGGDAFTRKHLDHPDRRVVTRIVGSKRYMPQPSGPFSGSDGDWILATDGYWTRDMARHVDDCTASDDCSALVLQGRGSECLVDSDVDNFLHVNAA